MRDYVAPEGSPKKKRALKRENSNTAVVFGDPGTPKKDTEVETFPGVTPAVLFDGNEHGAIMSQYPVMLKESLDDIILSVQAKPELQLPGEERSQKITPLLLMAIDGGPTLQEGGGQALRLGEKAVEDAIDEAKVDGGGLRDCFISWLQDPPSVHPLHPYSILNEVVFEFFLILIAD